MLYFDHNSTTPVAPEVAEVLAGSLREVFGNASSIHRDGQFARQNLEKSRRTIAEFIHASPAELVFTSGGTESNNIAILGLVRNLPTSRKHVITTAVEHPAVLEPCRHLEREGVDVTYVRCESNGIVDVKEIACHLRAETALISVIHANNEVGVVQPVQEIAALVKQRRNTGQQTFFHVDGVQAFGKIPVDVQEMGVDLYSVSAHKIYAPKGVGALFVRKGTPLSGIQYGGRHERERRPGTENVPGAMAFARAAELCLTDDVTRLSVLRQEFEAKILSRFPDVEVNGASAERLPNTSNLLFRGASGEAMTIALDMRGMAVSTGSACSSGSVEPSHVLLAMGRTRTEARSSIRFSFGRYNTLEDVASLVEALTACLVKMRKTARAEASVAV